MKTKTILIIAASALFAVYAGAQSSTPSPTPTVYTIAPATPPPAPPVAMQPITVSDADMLTIIGVIQGTLPSSTVLPLLKISALPTGTTSLVKIECYVNPSGSWTVQVWAQ